MMGGRPLCSLEKNCLEVRLMVYTAWGYSVSKTLIRYNWRFRKYGSLYNYNV